MTPRSNPIGPGPGPIDPGSIGSGRMSPVSPIVRTIQTFSAYWLAPDEARPTPEGRP